DDKPLPEDAEDLAGLPRGFAVFAGYGGLAGPGRRGAPPVPIAGREGRMAFASSCARTSFGPCSIWAPARRRRSRRSARRSRDTARSAFRWRTFGLAENPSLRVDLKLCSGNRVR